MQEVKVKVIVSEEVTNQFNGQANNVLFNPILVMKAPFVPTALSLGITVILANINTLSNKLKISILEPINNEEIYTTGYNNYDLPSEPKNYLFNLSLKNIPFMTEGIYTIEVDLNGVTTTDTFEVVAESDLH